MILLTVSNIGCNKEMRQTKVPLDTLWYLQESGSSHTRLFVLLPGRDSRHEDFSKNGFVKAVRDRELDVDLVAVDAHLGYYMNHSLIERLKKDVIDPALTDGYTDIWLVGISMGSMGSVYYLESYPNNIDGMLLLGPYLGEKKLLNEIRIAGGLEQWNPGEIKDDDWQRELWQFLKSYADNGVMPPIYVAYGTEDQYSLGSKLLTSVLPPDRELTVFGGHTWGVWITLWNAFLDKLSSQMPSIVIAGGKQHDMHKHHSFDDMERWITIFEDPKRRKWQKPEEVVKTLNLRSGDVVADIGAGTGYFTRLFASAVGTGGKALGLDTERAMVDYMRKDAEKLKLKNYIARLVKPDDTGLGNNSVDVIFICNTLHHIDNRVNYLKKLSGNLKHKGRIVIVDFYKRDLPVGPPTDMKLRKNEVINEFRNAGYRLIRSHDFLPYQYFLEFGL
jgi:ubiquinone/menaquinone biosynthesis C-methylase UbiE